MIYHVYSPAIALKKQHRDDKMHTLYIIHPLIGLFQHLIWLMILWTLLLSWISHIKYLARCKLKEWHMAQLSSSMCAASLIILLSHVSDSCSLQQNQVQQSMTLCILHESNSMPASLHEETTMSLRHYHGSELLPRKLLCVGQLQPSSIKMRLRRTISFATASSSRLLGELDNCFSVEEL